MSIADELEPKNIESYVNAGVQVVERMRSLNNEGYTNLLIPSRGAFPILHVGGHYLEACEQSFPNFELHTLPFTSIDLPSQDDMRRYWARVYQGITGEKGNPELLSYIKLLSFIGVTNERSTDSIKIDDRVVDIPRTLSFEDYINVKATAGKTLFIDTVISGRASATILEELDCHAILIVDKEGKKLQEPYKSQLKKLEREGKATLIPIKHLYTEDRGPAFLESNAYIFPDIIDGVNSDATLAGYNIHGAGIWRAVEFRPISLKEAHKNPNKLLTPWHVSARALSEIHRTKVNELLGITENKSEEMISLLVQLVNNTGMLSQEFTKRAYDADHVSSSHIIHVYSNPADVRKYVSELKHGLRANFEM